MGRSTRTLMMLGALAGAPAVHAIQIDLDYGDGITGTLNTSVTLGAAMRLQQRSTDLLGKGNLYPDLCGEREVDGQTINFFSCQGINQDDILPAQALTGIEGDLGTGVTLDGYGASGMFTKNADNGNWNYDQYDLIQAPLKVTQDLGLSYGDDFGVFGRWLYFYDFVNNDFEEYYPNYILADTPPTGPAGTDGQPTWGPGEEAYVPRTDRAALEQIGSDLQLLDAYAYAFLPFFGDRELTLKVGRQTVSWGESTLLVINSVNQANPVNANNLFRTGFTPEEVFTPVGMVYASTGITENLSLETYYQYEWDAVEAPTPGSFFSVVDAGTGISQQNTSISFGGNADDPLRRGRPLNNALNGLTDSTLNLLQRPDNNARDDGQYGVSFKYFAEDFNNGTDFGFYHMNYHSKLPYASFFASDLSCARTHPHDADGAAPPDGGTAETGAVSGNNASNTLELVAACPNLPLAENLANDPGAIFGSPGSIPLGDFLDALEDVGLPDGTVPGTGPVDDAVPLDTVQFQLEYPEDLKLYGMSFNTTFGDLSFQGEVAYRPNLPVQVSPVDLTFAALGPTLTSCHRYMNPEQFGTANNNGAECMDVSGQLSQSGSNTFNLIPPEPGAGPTGNGGDAPSVQRSYPSFITSYRGQTVGENIPNGYIRGYQEVKALEYNLGATYILGATDNPIGADQIIFLFETGANQILNMPERWEYQVDAQNTWRHAAAGVVDQNALGIPDSGIQNGSYPVTDESGQEVTLAWADLSDEQKQTVLNRVRQDAPGCYPGVCKGVNTDGDAYIGDGLRFNPQQETRSYATAFSWGYRVIAIVRYESVLPGISIQPFIVLSHDINGIMPGPGENFVEGRKNLLVNIETRYKSAWSFNLGGAWWTGGGAQNTLRDRDLLQFFVRYQF